MENGMVETAPFVQDLSRNLRKRDHKKVQELYEVAYPTITQSYYKNTPWPHWEKLSTYLEDENVVLLYKEMYFRHLHNPAEYASSSSAIVATLDDRLDSFQNYIDLFNLILGLTVEDPELVLPNSWVWDLIEGFVAQFCSFHHYRTKLISLSGDEIQQLKEHPHVWSPQSVIGYLHALAARAERNDDKPVAPFFLVLSDFCILGLSRVLCSLCDYTTSLSVLNALSSSSSSKGPVGSVWGAHLSHVYYMSFSLVMLRRYREAIVTLSDYLDEEERMLEGEALGKAVGVLALAVGLQPQALSEVLLDQIKALPAWHALDQGEVSGYEQQFLESCPRFVNPSLPNYDSGRSTHEDAVKQQLRIFKREVEHRRKLPEIHEYLKMCNSVSLAKLGTFVKSEETAIASMLLSIKMASVPLPRLVGAPALPPDPAQDTLDFAIDKDMVKVGELVRNVNYGKTFIRKILKLEDICDDIRRLAPRA